MENKLSELISLKHSKEFNNKKQKFIDFLNTNPEVLQLREKYNLTVEDLNWHLTRKLDFYKHECPVCGKPVHANKWGCWDFPTYCSVKCRMSDPKYWDKIKESNVKKYGTPYSFQSEIIKSKIKQTNLQRYGVENPAILDSIKEKAKATCLAKYGVVSTALVPEIRAKQKQTLLRNYGVDTAMQSHALKEKLIQTKISQGYDSLIQRCEKNPEGVEPLFSKEEYKGQSYDIEYSWKCKKCGEVFTHYYNNASIPVCRKCYPKYKERRLQLEILDFVKTVYSGEICFEERLINVDSSDKRKNLEVDIYLPERKLAFEINGSYWHSSLYRKPSYHKHKTKLCAELGIHLVHIMEYTWVNNPEGVKSRIKDLLGIYDQTVYARKCEVRKIEYNKAKEFLAINHLQGETVSSFNCGLFYKDELVGVMTFGSPRFNKKYSWELLRFCVKQGFHIPGAASKLLSFFVKEAKPDNLISYADRTWSNGKLYRALGFELEGETKPNYVYVKNNNVDVLHRYKCQKHKLAKLLGKQFDPSLSESENMTKACYWKVYDCGNLVFAKKFKDY